ncbi:MAG: hypothetical protein ACYCXN_06225 [Acidimicrobiales bacterium]
MTVESTSASSSVVRRSASMASKSCCSSSKRRAASPRSPSPAMRGVGQEAVGGQAVAFGTREPVLEEADLTA